MLRYNVAIVGKFFNKGSWVSEAWRKERPEEFEEEPTHPQERILTVEERRERLRLDLEPESAVCAASGNATSNGVRLTSAERGNPNLQEERTNRPG